LAFAYVTNLLIIIQYRIIIAIIEIKCNKAKKRRPFAGPTLLLHD